MLSWHGLFLLLLLSCFGLQFNYWSHNPTLVTILIDVYNPAPWLHRRVDGRLRSGAPPPFVSGNVETSYGDSEDSDDESEDGCDDDSAATDSEDDRHPAPQRRPPPRAPVPAPAPAEPSAAAVQPTALAATTTVPGYAILSGTTLAGGLHSRTFSSEMKITGLRMMVDGILPSEVSSALRRGTKLVLGRPWDRSFPTPGFWRRHRIAVIALMRLFFATQCARSAGFAMGHDGTSLNKIDTLGVVLQLLMDVDDDELVNISSGPLVIHNQKSVTEVDAITALFQSGREAMTAVKAMVEESGASPAEKRVALALLGEAIECNMEKTAIIISDFANGAQKTSSDLSKLAPVARVVNCAEHAFENVSNACMAAEKKFLTEQLCEKKGTSALAKDDKPLVEVNSFLYSTSKLLHITTTQTYYLSLGAIFERWFRSSHQSSVLHRMMRFRGSRFYAGLVNRSVLHRMLGYYTEFLSSNVGDHNKIQESVLFMLRMFTTELAGWSGAFWTDQLVRPGRYALQKNGRGNVAAAKQFASALVAFLTSISEVRTHGE